MPDEKEYPRLVAPEEGEANPTSIFDNLDSLRKAQELIVKRKVITATVDVGRPPNDPLSFATTGVLATTSCRQCAVTPSWRRVSVASHSPPCASGRAIL